MKSTKISHLISKFDRNIFNFSTHYVTLRRDILREEGLYNKKVGWLNIE